jgi:hypothetical protein
VTDALLLYVGGGLTAFWGIAHLFPTKSVVAGFGEISADNRRIITMEWIVEGVALAFMGVLVCTVTVVDRSSAAARAAYAVTVLGLLALAIVSFFTGFRVAFLPFKLCPFIFGLSAALILIGGVL